MSRPSETDSRINYPSLERRESEGSCGVKGLCVSLRKKNVDPLGPGQAIIIREPENIEQSYIDTVVFLSSRDILTERHILRVNVLNIHLRETSQVFLV